MQEKGCANGAYRATYTLNFESVKMEMNPMNLADDPVFLQLRADARRYRWVKEKAPGALCAVAWRIKAACSYSEPDDAIDAAMGRPPKASNENSN